MSLIVFATTPEGMVLSADSRQTYINRRGMARVGSDNVYKLFQLNRRIGIGHTGIGIIVENNLNKTISKLIEEFKNENNDLETLGVKDMSNKVFQFFSKKFNFEKRLKETMESYKENLMKRGFKVQEILVNGINIKYNYIDLENNKKTDIINVQGRIDFLISGYNEDKTYEVYSCHVPGGLRLENASYEKGREYGLVWEGQKDVVTRIIKGFDPRISNIQFVRDETKIHGDEKVIRQMDALQYSIQWDAMALQDAVDFCDLMIKTTSAIQRFSDGILADPGDMNGVGGPVDVAIITPEKGFRWLKRKKIELLDEKLEI